MNKIVLLFYLILLCISCSPDTKTVKFSTEKWKSGSQLERGNMVTDLVESNILIGKSKIEVTKLLGIPKDSSKTNYLYLVDFGYMTPFYLDIEFDFTTKKVQKVILND